MQAACTVGSSWPMLPKASPAPWPTSACIWAWAFRWRTIFWTITADPGALGKPVGTDLREGKLTLPLIHAFSRVSKPDRFRIAKIVGSGEFSSADFSRIVSRISDAGGFAYTRQQAQKHADAAKKALSILPDSPARQCLIQLASYVVNRDA